jgi:hypothetical protein
MIASDLMVIADAFLGHLGKPWLRYGDSEIEVLGSLRVAPDGPDSNIFTGCHWVISYPWRVLCPRVFCDASWIRRAGAAWHLNVDGSLCYVHPLQWRDCARKLVKTMHGIDLARVFADFAYNNLSWLLQRHLEAHRLGLKVWPTEWPQWLHGDDGAAQYAREGEESLNQLQFRRL